MFATDLKVTPQSFITPFYATYVRTRDTGSRNLSPDKLEADYTTYLNFRNTLEAEGFLSVNDENMDDLQFSAPKSERAKRRIRAISFYSQDYLKFLTLDTNYQKKTSPSHEIDFMSSPIFSYSLTKHEITRLAFNSNILLSIAADNVGLDKTNFSTKSFSIEDTLKLLREYKSLIRQEFVVRHYDMTDKNLRDFIACVRFASTKQSVLQIAKLDNEKISEFFDYIIKAIVNEVAPLKLMFAFSVSFYHHSQITSPSAFNLNTEDGSYALDTIISVDDLIENKDIPATYLAELFMLNIDDETLV